jgi:hypothetical protein
MRLSLSFRHKYAMHAMIRIVDDNVFNVLNYGNCAYGPSNIRMQHLMSEAIDYVSEYRHSVTDWKELVLADDNYVLETLNALIFLVINLPRDITLPFFSVESLSAMRRLSDTYVVSGQHQDTLQAIDAPSLALRAAQGTVRAECCE